MQFKIMDFTDNPTIDFVFFQKTMSFLNAKKSNIVCKTLTIKVINNSLGFVSRNIRFVSS